ncbi:hypothetical protein HGG75_18230 [Ochrobactrum pseudogrignonense]|nr:hypothetical protein [Brucella pseudogrignonensis]
MFERDAALKILKVMSKLDDIVERNGFAASALNRVGKESSISSNFDQKQMNRAIYLYQIKPSSM